MHKVGLIGYGSMGKNHARVLSKLESVDFIGIYDIDQSKDFKNYNTYNNIQNLIDDSSILIISTPTNTHHDLVLKVIEQNKHILVEKPYSINQKDIINIKKITQNKEVYLKIGLLEKYNPAVMFLKEQTLEKISSIYLNRLSPQNQENRNQEHVLLDLTIHDFSIVLEILKCDVEDFKFEFFFNKLQPNNHVDIFGYLNNVSTSISTSKLFQKKVRDLVINTEERLFKANLITGAVEISYGAIQDIIDNDNTLGYRENLNSSYPLIDYREPLEAQFLAFLKDIKERNIKKVNSELIKDLNLHYYLLEKIK